MTRFHHILPLAVLLFVSTPWTLLAQTERSYNLNLADALALAEGKSESVDIARAGVRSAEAEQLRARAQRLPQLFGNASYTRTLETQYSGAFSDGGAATPPCDPLAVSPNAPVAERVTELERFLACGGPTAVGGGAGLSDLPFGRANTYVLGLSLSQSLFTGGRLLAQSRLANALKESAELEVDSSNAQFVLDVTVAFYDATLADRLLEIARASLADAQQTLEFVELGFETGRLPEFDVLRAAVSRRNQEPEVGRREAARDQAYLRLKQLLDLPSDATLRLDADLDSAALPVPDVFADRWAEAQPMLDVYERSPVRQADAAVRQREATVEIAQSQRWPSITLNSDFGLFAYPDSVIPTASDRFRKNWTVGAALQLPILTFGRIRADVESAKANLDQATAQRRLTRELAALDTSVVLSQLHSAADQWDAAGSGLIQAQRAAELAALRYREGISSQLELSDSRLALQQTQVNRAQAARDLQVARVTVALLPLLPINVGPQAPSQTRPLQQQQGQQQFGGQGGNPFGGQTSGTAQPPNAAPSTSGVPGVPAGQMGIPGSTRSFP